MIEGWIKLHRQFIKWEWYDDANVMRVFLHCLLLANHEDKKWRGNMVKRGSFITSYNKMGVALNLSIQQVRTALDKLKKTGEITTKTTSQYTTVCVCNYNDYQGKENKDNTQNNKQATGEQQSNNNQITTTKNDNNYKNDKKNSLAGISHELKNEIPEWEEFWRYAESKGYHPDYAKHLYDSRLSEGWRRDNGNFIEDWMAYLNMSHKYQRSWLQKQKELESKSNNKNNGTNYKQTKGDRHVDFLTS